MKFYHDQVSDINIAYIGGGSRNWAWILMNDLAVEEKLSGTIRLYDIDIQAAIDNEKIGNSLCNNEHTKGVWKYVVCEALSEALENANFVVISVLPGTLAEMATDVHEPENYGIFQSVGDSTGPGGIMRALRTIPMFVVFAEAIMKHCPDAWVINYTNPMSICTRTLYEVYPKIKAFGCCHEVFGTQSLLITALADYINSDDHKNNVDLFDIDSADRLAWSQISRSDVRINVLGINHFTWLDRAVYKNIDLLSVFESFSERYYDDGYEGEIKDRWKTDCFDSAQRVKFDLFERYHVLAAAGDRHLAEFCPGGWYLKDLETVASWKFNLTPVSWRVKYYEQKREQASLLLTGQKKLTPQKSGEEGISQIKAILGLGDMITNVNLPNIGQMPKMPLGTMLETNAVFSKDSVVPVFAGFLPDSVQNLVGRIVQNQEALIHAFMKKDKISVFNVFLNDPLVNIGINDARTLFSKMLRKTSNYLSGWMLD